MHNRFKLYTPIICALMVLCAVLVLLTPFFSQQLFYISVSVTLLIFAVVLVLLRRVNVRAKTMLQELGKGIERANEGNFIDFPMPVITVYEGSEIIWYNELCARQVFRGQELRGEEIAGVLPGLDVSRPSPPEGYNVVYGNQGYTAFVSRSARVGENISVIYLVNDTALKYYANEYHQTKPSIIVIMVDNYEEMTQDLKDAERAQIVGGIEREIERYITVFGGFLTRIERDKFMAIVEERGMERIMSSKFDLLDRVRALQFGEKVSATISMGVGRGAKTLFEGESMARQALEMCLGRGGDQVAVKTQNGYEFYGGVSKGVEKRTKVKTRIIASALSELIESSSNVIVMGHRFADLDSLGSAVGILKSVKSMNKPGVICVDRTKNLVQPLISKMLSGGYSPEDFVQPEQIISYVEEKTLLIIVDTHISNVLENEQLYRDCKTVVVIDHHRKLVHYIDNAVIFYHEPYASSASEMVAELLQYFPSHPQITKMEAEAMLAGIMLDTKNFVLRTGVRTFEAAAYLRRLGADTVEVRKLFASTMDSYQQKANIVSNAEIYEQCAIAAPDFQFDGIKTVAPQAADELMNITGVEASFVIYNSDGVINVSARSMGAVNVQIIMERLGGGGHHAMAAAQFPGESIENIRKVVMEAINEYHAAQSETRE